MATDSQIRALLKAWLDYIHVENLSNAKVEADDSEQPNIWDSLVNLVGDKLLIDESLFKKLKQPFKSAKNFEQTKLPSIAVAFPQLYVVESNRRQFRPLFTINVSPIFEGNYRSSGWDLTQYEFQPVIPNLMQWYGLEEEAAESLVTREGLKVFLETTFNRPFKTLQDFMGLIELPPFPVRSKLLPYLLDFDYAAFNYNLKKDFQKISDQNSFQWSRPGHPAYEYLFGQPKSPQHEVLFLGAFPNSQADDYQALALKHSQSHPVTAVIGPPGNGKTTLLLHKIAQQVVGRAVDLATTGQDKSNLTVVTSTNKFAVNNVEKILANNLTSDRFYLSGGSRDLVESQVLPSLQAALDWLAKETFKLDEWESAKQQLLAGVQQIQDHRQQDEHDLQQKSADEQLLDELCLDIQSVESALKTSAFESSSPLEFDCDYNKFPLEAYQQIGQYLDSARRSLPSEDYWQNKSRNDFWFVKLLQTIKRFWQSITKTSHRHVLKRLHKQIEMPVLATLATPFQFQIPLTTESLIAAQQSVDQLIAEALNWQQQQNGIDSTQQQIESRKQQLKDLITRRSQIENRLATYPSKDFYSRFYTELHSLQVELFEWSWQFQQQEALRRKDEVMASFRTYIALLNGEWDAFRQLSHNWRNIYRDISLLFPVFLCTLHSIRNLLPYPDSGCIDQVIVDEAGQIPPQQVFPVLVRCNRALIVGDPLQLEPVVNLSDQKKEEYRSKSFLEQGLTDVDYDRYSPTASTAYHRAAGASGQPRDIGQGIILKYHYRCVPVIANFCDRLCNYGMVIKTEPFASRLGTNLIACHVEGKLENNVNWAEVDAVEALIEELLAAGYCLNPTDSDNTIGVISPYRRQVDALTQRLKSRWSDFSPKSIGTVHTFQGGQKSVIIFSTRQCQSTDSLWFINRRPNLLNVAVSRARELFILVGNLERISEGGHTRELVEYIREFGEMQ
ncbi:MAG: AAA domain-containing protein [Nostoc sp. DedQUE04]|uniref:DEAD/DEAH box helicase n=1 Tax=Nostoc sp. DedQUE04 TaxID=3075390 RepID=UPI002AD1F2B9|nr:AAA domain-containing protein [Nostoc sp. DedQUE04]MDZ8141134.1 AAA domain-containing protein [Nostoc sp. DedQUE04]